MIKKFYFLPVFFLVFFMIWILHNNLFAQSAESLPSFQILASGSIGYASNSDINKATKGSGQEDVTYLNSIAGGDYFSADNTGANFTYGFDLSFRIFFDNIGLGGEVGYHTAEAKSKVTSSVYTDKTTTTSSLDVVPVVITLFYRIGIDSMPNSFVLVGAGAGYYNGKLKIVDKYENGLGSSSDWLNVKGKQSTIGYQAVLEYDYILSSLTFFTGIKARYVQFSKFEDSGYAITNNGDNIEGGLTGINWYLGVGLSI